jgi:hypothetical protein
MRKLVLIFCFLFPGTALLAQEAVDFSFTDTDGVEHNLFTELNAGKTIMLDFFFTSCGPCQYWSSSINNVYQQFGSGDADVEFWSFTPYDNNNAVIAYDNTYGIEFPSCSIDGGSLDVIDLYTSGTYGPFLGYPTYVVICPDRSVTWDVWPITENAPEIASVLESCSAALSTKQIEVNPVISGIYPNPAANRAAITISTPRTNTVGVEIFDMLGNQAIGRIEKSMPAGKHVFELPIDELAEGAYLVRTLVNGNLLSTSRLIINR